MQRNRLSKSGAAKMLGCVCAAVLAGSLAACSPQADAEGATLQTDAASIADPIPPGEREPLGLMTSLPIYWPDGVALTDLVARDAKLPWVRTHLEGRFDLSALDTLSPQDGDADEAALPDDAFGEAPPTLASLGQLMVIQPRGLTPADNVALDDWVTQGGELLLALDPMLAGHYSYPLGDPRNPQMSTLVPPVLARWGLTIVFDEKQPLAIQTFAYDGGALPAVMSGELGLADAGVGQGDETQAAPKCALEAQGRVAVCDIGEGRATIVADATVFEVHDWSDAAASDLQALLDKAFS